MGVFESEPFAAGTAAIAHAAADANVSVLAGGEAIAAVRTLGLANRFSHVSTGGGATLERLDAARDRVAKYFT